VTPKRRELFHQMFDAQNEAFAALRIANTSMGASIQAHDEAIQAALRANQAAIDILNEVAGPDAQRES